MSRTRFDDKCKGCEPAVLDASTGRPVPDDSLIMRAVKSVWDATTRSEREAFHRVTCLNSRDPSDLVVIQQLSQKIQEASAATN